MSVSLLHKDKFLEYQHLLGLPAKRFDNDYISCVESLDSLLSNVVRCPVNISRVKISHFEDGKY